MVKRKWITMLCCTVVGLAVGAAQIMNGLAEPASAGEPPQGLADAAEPAWASAAPAPEVPAAGPGTGDVDAPAQAAEPDTPQAEQSAGEPAEPAPEPEQPAEPEQPTVTEPSQPAEPEQSAPESPQPAEPEQPPVTEPLQPAEPGLPETEPSQPATEPSQPAEPGQPSEPPELAESSAPSVPEPPTGPSETEPTVPEASSEPSQSSQPSEPGVPDGSLVAPEMDRWIVTYALRAGDAGTLPFLRAAVQKGRAIGFAQVPAPILPAGFELEGYAMGARVLTALELAACVPEQDVNVEVRIRAVEEKTVDPLTVYDPSWDVPPAWAGNGQGYVRGNLPAAAEHQRLAKRLMERIEAVRADLNLDGSITIDMGADHFADVLAVYAVISRQTEGFPYDVEMRDVSLFRHIYWSMTQVNGMSNHKDAHIRVRQLSISEAGGVLGLTDQQKTQASALAAARASAVQDMLKASVLSRLSDEAVSALEARVPQNIPSARRSVLLAALSLENQVRYFWGGKSFNVGWDDRWGQLRKVTSPGDDSTGSVSQMGLDCSGFVTWAFINGGGSSDLLNYIGNGTSGQYVNTRPLEWNAVRPGDLLFYNTPAAGSDNHVGIVVTVHPDGSPKTVVHCAAGSANGVVVTGAEGFKIARRPYIFND